MVPLPLKSPFLMPQASYTTPPPLAQAVPLAEVATEDEETTVADPSVDRLLRK